jgi:hypothetical protein
MSIARTRVRRYRPHGSALWVICMGNQEEEKREFVEQCVMRALERHETGGRLGGFAFMVWDTDGSSTVDAANMDGTIPTILIPDFVRNRLLAARIEQWTLDTLYGL